jgi:hypothetical protein
MSHNDDDDDEEDDNEDDNDDDDDDDDDTDDEDEIDNEDDDDDNSSSKIIDDDEIGDEIVEKKFILTLSNGDYDAKFDNKPNYDRSVIPPARPTQASYNRPDNWKGFSTPISCKFDL